MFVCFVFVGQVPWDRRYLLPSAGGEEYLQLQLHQVWWTEGGERSLQQVVKLSCDFVSNSLTILGGWCQRSETTTEREKQASQGWRLEEQKLESGAVWHSLQEKMNESIINH